MKREEAELIFDRWCKKLRLNPGWDVRLEWGEDESWRKTGDFKIDCDDKKAVLMLNAANPRAGKRRGGHSSRAFAPQAVSARPVHRVDDCQHV